MDPKILIITYILILWATIILVIIKRTHWGAIIGVAIIPFYFIWVLLEATRTSGARKQKISPSGEIFRDEIGPATSRDHLVGQQKEVTQQKNQVECLRCGVAVTTESEMKRKYMQVPTGIWAGSLDDLQKAKSDRDAIGVTCAVCASNFCSGCMIKYGKPHPKSGGISCLQCGGHMTIFSRR